MEKTFTIVKPDSTEKGNIGNIIAMIEKNGFKILAMKQTRLPKAVAEEFYAEHAERGFFGELIDYMTSGPVVVAVLEKENGIKDLRTLMGATNPADADEGTIRKLYGESISFNAIHGSANAEDAAREVNFFFGSSDLL